MALTEGWAEREMREAKLDTPRRRRNLILICEKLARNAGKSLSAALGDATRQAAYNLFSRAKRTVDDLLAGHVKATAERCREAAGPVYVIQDSVRLDYFTHRGCAGLGPVGASPASYGLWGHSALTVSAEGLPLGVLGLKLWAREAAAHGQRKQRQQREISAKESRVWAETLAAVEKALPPDIPLILVQDRGADVYAFWVAPRRANTDFVVRAYEPRRTRLLPDPMVPTEGAAPAAPSEWAGLPTWRSQAPVRVAERRVRVSERPATPQKSAEPEREAVVEIRSSRVEIAGPQTKQGRALPPTIVLWAVWVREVNPPEGRAPVEWLLLTTLYAGTDAAALAVVHAYEQRWIIERLHRVLKSGLHVERFQLDDVESLKNALALSWVVAWQLLRLTEAARVEPEAPAAEWLAPEERAVLGAHFGKPPQTLREALRLVAKYGGWPGATKAATPGTDVLWRGFRDLAIGVRTWRQALSHH